MTASVNLVCDSKPGRLHRTEQNLIVCIGKFEAEVLHKRLRSKYCNVNAILQDIRPFCDSRASEEAEALLSQKGHTMLRVCLVALTLQYRLAVTSKIHRRRRLVL